MGKLNFNVIKLTPEQAKRNIRPDDFPEKNAYDPTWRIFEPFLPTQSQEVSSAGFHSDKNMRGVPGGNAYVHVSQTFEINHHGNLKNSIYVGFGFSEDYVRRLCGGNSFMTEYFFDRRINLPAHTIVTGVDIGDYNNDGHTDLLIRLTDGAAYLFVQVPGDPPKMECVPRPRRFYPPPPL